MVNKNKIFFKFICLFLIISLFLTNNIYAKDYSSVFNISVFRDITKKVSLFNLEEYVAGVVACEMGPRFHPEALKAQAVLARTFAVNRIWDKYNQKTLKPATDYDVRDTVMDQVFCDKTQLIKKWGSKRYYDQKWPIIEAAVAATKDMILTYNNQPIRVFFSSSNNGCTQAAHEYFAGDMVPYLATFCINDKEFAHTSEAAFSIADFKQRLRNAPNSSNMVSKYGQTYRGRIRTELISDSHIRTLCLDNRRKTEKNIKRYNSNYINYIKLGPYTFTGRFIRETLGLKSNDFVCKFDSVKKKIKFEVRGYGHGIGMSQYGANLLANKYNNDFRRIIHTYFKNVKIETQGEFINRINAIKMRKR